MMIDPTPTSTLTRTPVTPTSTPTAVMADTQVWRFYSYAGSARIAVGEKSSSSNQLFFLLSDHLAPCAGLQGCCASGTSKTVDANGQVVAELRYTAFGETWYENGNTPTELRYTGQRSFEDLGLYFYQSRFYDAMLGRFVQADTMAPNPGSPLAWDRFSYARNNPVRFTDPTGHRVDDGCETEGCTVEPNIGTTNSNSYQNNNSNQVNTDSDFSNAILILDVMGAVLSGFEAGITDGAAVILITAGCGGGAVVGGVGVAPGCAAGLGAAVLYDLSFSTASPIAVLENILGLTSASLTGINDFSNGSSKIYFDESGRFGISIGVDTIVSTRNFIAGLVPESNLDAAISFSQLKYDFDRMQGNKAGGSIDIIRPTGQTQLDLYNLMSQIYIKDWW